MNPKSDIPDGKKLISIIVPVFNEAANVVPLFQAVEAVFNDSLPQFRWEIIFVNDGSNDDSWIHIKRLSRDNPEEVKGLSLSRNFGKELALTAGLEAVDSAHAVLFMDADMQHPPELIPEFIRCWEEGFEIVVGIRRTVADYSFVKTTGSRIFYWIMRNCSEVDIPLNSTDFRLLDMKVASVLRTFKERTRMFRGLIDWMGFNRTVVEFDAPSRLNEDNPAYSFSKLVNLAINSITSFSLLPLRATGFLGILVSSVSFSVLSYMLIADFFDFSFFTPLAYVVVCLTFLMGIVLCGLGMLALYIGHIHAEVVHRPLYVLRETTNEAKDNSLDS